MVVFLNLLLPLVMFSVAILTYWFCKTSTNKAVTVFKGISAAVVFYLLYAALQPSYLPKGEVKPLPKVEQEVVKDIQIEDRLLKPLSKEESKRRVDELLTAKDEIKEIIKTKENK